MSLKVYNTLTGRKEEFTPLKPGKVRMYVCGVTVYDYCHIGHARSAMVFDVIRNYLEYKDYDVLFVKNFTDVDDKIIKRAQEEDASTRELAKKFIAAHNEDMARLGIRPPDVTPKATDHIDEMIAMIHDLVERDAAYAAEGDVYFAVKRFSEYGKLSGRNVDDMRAGARIEVDERKRDPLDFTLWKASKPGEPSWDSPWSKGRPAWHIECSAMAGKYLGLPFDIHGGGKDLIFPHHENEIAQSEASSGKPFARYWLHNGFVSINKEKMSKSLGNFFTVREVLEQFSPETVRYLMLSAHYRSPLDYSDARLHEAAASLKNFYQTFHQIETLRQQLVRQEDRPAALPSEVTAALAALPQQTDQLAGDFEAAMDDDFNTAAAIGVLFKMRSAINDAAAVLEAVPEARCHPTEFAPLTEAVARLKTLAGVLGLTFAEAAQSAEPDHGLLNQVMGLLLDIRKEARAQRNWALADRIRDELAQAGIQVHDRPDGESHWELNT